jgi:hypothetical protein
MTIRSRVFLAAISCVAALSFAAGRLVTNPTADRIIERSASDSAPRALNLLAPVSAPAEVPNIIGLPFVESYRILKSATPDTVRSYYGQLDQLPIGPRRNAPLTAFFKILVQANPSLAKDLILELKKDDRWLPMWAIRDAATPRGMETVAEVLLSFDRIEISGCSYDILRDHLDEWGKNDPLALKKFLETNRSRDVERYFEKLILNWAMSDPESAQKWMAEEVRKRPVLPNIPQEDGSEIVQDSNWKYAVEGMAAAWVQGFLHHDPDVAVSYVLEHLDNEAVKRALFQFSAELFTMSPDRARDFILRLPESEQSDGLSGVGNQANMLVRNDGNDITSPRYVAEWMLQFPPEESHIGMQSVLRTWQQANPEELFAWMADLPPQNREAVVRQFPAYVSTDNTQEDFDTIMLAGDPVLREQLLEKLMRNAKDARDVMLGVLEKAQLSPLQRSHLAALIPLPDDSVAAVDN